jgi:hypothetical protein
MYWTLVTDIKETAELVERTFSAEADGIKAWDRMRRSGNAYSTTLWCHQGRHLGKVRDYDCGE